MPQMDLLTYLPHMTFFYICSIIFLVLMEILFLPAIRSALMVRHAIINKTAQNDAQLKASYEAIHKQTQETERLVSMYLAIIEDHDEN